VFETNFGIEIEFTGITRKEAAEAVAQVVRGRVSQSGYAMEITQADGRKWKLVYDSSVSAQRKERGRIRDIHDSEYQCELVSPILTYTHDIGVVQAIVRKLRKQGAFAPDTAGIHIHLDGAQHTPRSIRNFVNIIASKNDLLYNALCIKAERQRFCKKLDAYLVEQLNRSKPRTFEQIADIWYAGYGYESRSRHYHNSRYHFLNLHSFFTDNHTVELCGFNSELHAGKVRTWIVLALALNHHALSLRFASSTKVQAENPAFAMRTFLNRIGLIGEEYRSCREHLCKHLDGNSAWRYGSVNGRSARLVEMEEREND
jgi:hypothetical protein